MGHSFDRKALTRALGTFAVLFTLVFASGASADPATDIVGGSEVASIDDWPFVAAISHDQNPEGWVGCAGALIRPQWVLTLKTCVDVPAAENDSYHVIVGRTGLFGGVGGSIIAVDHILRNPAFNADYDANNLALLRLREPAPAPAQPIALSAAGNLLSLGDAIDVAGWGITDPASSLMYGALNAVSLQKRDFCDPNVELDPEVTGPAFCAGSADDQPHSICASDEGGPAVHDFGDGKRLVGLANWFIDCADPDYGSMFVDLTSSTTRDWVDLTIDKGLSYSPSSLDFGEVDVRAGPVVRTVTVKNVGETSFDPGSPVPMGGGRTSGPRYNWTYVSRDGCNGHILDPDQTCSFDLTFFGGLLGRDAGEVLFAKDGQSWNSTRMPFSAHVFGDARVDSFAYVYGQALRRVKRGKLKGQRYLRTAVAVSPNGTPFIANTCSGDLTLKSKLKGAKKSVTKRGKISKITWNSGTFCGAYFNVHLPKKPKKISGTIALNFAGNEGLRPGVGSGQIRVGFTK